MSGCGISMHPVAMHRSDGLPNREDAARRHERSVDDLQEGWAKVRFTSQRRGRQLTHADAWIAATALLYHVHLVTRNRRHFEGVDRLQVISGGP